MGRARLEQRHLLKNPFFRFALKGIVPKKGRYTKNPAIWMKYAMWVVRNWFQMRYGLLYIFNNSPAWEKWLSRLLNTGRYSHRSDFTDAETGLLYGGTGWSHEAFEQFIDNITPTGLVKKGDDEK